MESNKTRTDLLNFLIEKHGLKSYLEIGLQNAAQNFDKIKCEHKSSVDPNPNAKADFKLTSDDFFYFGFYYNRNAQELLGIEYDIIFIDGLHTAEQVQKDFENALKILSPKGFIVLHDCNPLKEDHTIVPRPTERGHWNGDVYKFAIQLGISRDLYCTVDIDNGCGVFANLKRFDLMGYTFPINWKYFDENRKQLLNLISWDEFVSNYSHV